MSTVYNGVPANVTPTTTYSVTEPADGDPAIAASVNNPGPFQSLADLGAFTKLLGFGQIGFNPASGLLPAAVGVTGPTALNNYVLISSWIWAAGSPKNLRAFIRTNDGAIVFTQNCKPDGATNKWAADSTTDNAMAMFIGGTFFPGTSAAPNASPFGGGWCVATKSKTATEWVDKSPNQGGIGWESVIQWQGIPNTSGPGGGAQWQIGATQPGTNETTYTSIQASDLTGVIDVYASGNVIFHGQKLQGLGAATVAGDALRWEQFQTALVANASFAAQTGSSPACSVIGTTQISNNQGVTTQAFKVSCTITAAGAGAAIVSGIQLPDTLVSTTNAKVFVAVTFSGSTPVVLGVANLASVSSLTIEVYNPTAGSTGAITLTLTVLIVGGDS